MSRLILAIDDEEAIREAIVAALEPSGYRVITAASGEEGLDVLKSETPDLIILDLMLPRIHGLDLCSTIREHSEVPIIMLTGMAAEDDRVEGLTRGADDYMTKPFRARELAARVRAVLRRSEHWSSDDRERIEVGDIEVRPQARELLLGGRRVSLTPKEFALMEYLARNAGKVVERERLLKYVWGEHEFIDERTLDVHVRWLREKLEDNPSDPKRILTVRGQGYLLAAE